MDKDEDMLDLNEAVDIIDEDEEDGGAGERDKKHYKRENCKCGPKPESRKGCDVHMRILKRGEKFVVTQFQTAHNHPMVPKKL
ncbi:hypothetical protein CCACVL1_04770 [Corchorus capsularis]|uniref:FAR1 domain-containing protein n=1 Tax=Corchorus capsularis TaxID=210143 RepID=A0A1R3JPQ3_COCAP|nr:hypothetical protein CCACVL1_04770 [Corchorus capsularis]